MAGPSIQIIETSDSDESKEIVRSLRAYNKQLVGEHITQPLTLVLRRELSDVQPRDIVGGLNGMTHFGWFYVQHLWVSDQYHGQGLGRRLLDEGEAIAIKRGCTSAYLDTFSPRALGFYKKLGYTEFGSLQHFPVGYTRTFLQKKLGPA